MHNNKRRKNNRRPQDVKPLTDLELIKLGLRNPEIKLDQKVFQKSPAEKQELKYEKKKHKKYLKNSNT